MIFCNIFAMNYMKNATQFYMEAKFARNAPIKEFA